MDDDTQEILSSEKPLIKRFFSFSAENTKWILLFLLIFLSLSGGLFLNLRNNSSDRTPASNAEDKSNTKNEFIASNSIVYGYWIKGNSVIAVLDLSTNQNSIIAELPSNIKHIRVLDPQRIIYIKDTDGSDYGKEIVIRNLEAKTETTIIKADDTFGIDDYVVSPSSRYLAVWEVSPPTGSTQLFGGKSRVYTADVQKPLQKNLIYDETSGLGITLAYPIAITDKGELFTDRFLPNSGAGWGYGMSVSDLTGTNKQDIASLANGMISTQPTASSDGEKLLFAGYDGRKGLGTIEVDGFRRAILSSNTIEIFDLATKQKKKILSTNSNDIYSDPNWDILTGNIIYKLLSKNDALNGTYIYNLSTNTSEKIDTSGVADNSISNSTTLPNIIAVTSINKYIVVDEINSDSALGNLGSKYGQSLNAIYLYDTAARSKNNFNLGTGIVQLVDIKPQNFFSSLSLAQNSTDGSKNQLQLQTFELKPSLAPKRNIQQSDPSDKKVDTTCRSMAARQCNELLGTNYPVGVYYNWDLDFEVDPKFIQCWKNTKKELQGTCTDSPLYLYGQEGKNVNIYSTTPIYPLNTNYSPAKGYSISLGENGSFIVNREKVSSLKFDYTPAIKIIKPDKGYLVTKDKVQDIIEKISNQLELNEKEIADTLNYFKEKIVSPYAFISLFDDETSKKILPLIISPTPDTYRNTVFYIENLDENPNVSYVPPVIEKIQRKGFTAIEISFIVR